MPVSAASRSGGTNLRLAHGVVVHWDLMSQGRRRRGRWIMQDFSRSNQGPLRVLAEWCLIHFSPALVVYFISTKNSMNMT
jgi:hypothetical protein